MNNKIRVAVIPADLTQSTRFEAIDNDLDAFQGLVGGYIEEMASPFVGTQLIVNEEGMLRGLPVNERVSRLAGVHVVGDAILVGTDGGPDYTSLSPEWFDARAQNLNATPRSPDARIENLNNSRSQS